MKNTLRSLAFGLAVILAGAVMAQYPYTIYMNGVVTGCYAGQTVNVQTIQGTQPPYDFDVPVDANTCTWSATLGVSSSPAWFMASTMCNGAIVSFSDSVYFNFINDSSMVNITLNCGGGGVLDCEGTLNGPEQPGTDCMSTENGEPGMWDVQCWCDTTYFDDCLGVTNGPDVPGSFCINFFGDTGVWSVNCVCIVDTSIYDCENVLNGDALPGTACDDSNPATSISFWNTECICVGDTASYYDCMQVINGPDVPGSPCQAFGMVGTWSAQCVCEPNNVDPCQADFWVLQAWGPDSLPVPYELWVWNLSTGGTGTYAYSWSFGDGATSTEPYPTHVYNGNGPYALCLTLYDINGCVSTHCDSISIDENGIYNGVLGGGGDREDGFTLNVQNPVANSIAENALDGIAVWPNPATNALNVALASGFNGDALVTITDLNGRVVSTERHNLNVGRNQLVLNINELDAGIYMVRVSDGTHSTGSRFMKNH